MSTDPKKPAILRVDADVAKAAENITKTLTDGFNRIAQDPEFQASMRIMRESLAGAAKRMSESLNEASERARKQREGKS